MVIYTPSTSFLVRMKTSRRSPPLPRTFLGELISLPLPVLAPAQPVLRSAREPGFVLGKLSHQGLSGGHEGYPGFIRDPSQGCLSSQ